MSVFKVSGNGPLYLTLKRSAGDKLFPGIWQIVTGVIEKGEHAVHAAVREVREETGLLPQRLWRLPLVNSFYDPGKDVVHFCPHFAVEVAN
ncbi:MAG TPA: NUDIX domain-containing protein, partial [Bacteroidota bacterium]